MCNFKIRKITYSKRSLQQGMTIAKISLRCILKPILSLVIRIIPLGL